MRIGVAKRDGLAQAVGQYEDIVELLKLLHGVGALTRWTVCGYDGGMSVCWPLAGEEV